MNLRLGDFSKTQGQFKELYKYYADRGFSLRKLQVYYYEYSGDFKAAYERMQTLDVPTIRSEEILEYYVMAIRTACRVNNRDLAWQYLGEVEKALSTNETFAMVELNFPNYSLLPFPYRTLLVKNSKVTHAGIVEVLRTLIQRAVDGEKFQALYKRAQSSIANLTTLESHLQKNDNFFLKSVCEPGVLNIVLHDVLNFYELTDRLSLLDSIQAPRSVVPAS
jgi:hypothetical protein